MPCGIGSGGLSEFCEGSLKNRETSAENAEPLERDVRPRFTSDMQVRNGANGDLLGNFEGVSHFRRGSWKDNCGGNSKNQLGLEIWLCLAQHDLNLTRAAFD